MDEPPGLLHHNDAGASAAVAAIAVDQMVDLETTPATATKAGFWNRGLDTIEIVLFYLLVRGSHG